ncbi:MAG: UbiA family prenyltransferase [Terrimesophilobacter sp.]
MPRSTPNAESEPKRAPRTLVSLALASHPGPTIAVTTVAVVLGVGVGMDAARLVLLGVAFLCNQVSVGLSNDWLDAPRDRVVGRGDKPVALGWISAATVRTASFCFAGAAVAFTVPLGVAATLVHVVFIASAWGYNLGLKSTPLSVLPYALSFALLPLVVTLSLPEPKPAAWWAMGMGAMLGVAAHFTNVIPDLGDDRRTGVRGLPHVLGRVWGGVVTFLALVAAAVLAVVGTAPTATGRVNGVQWIGFGATLVIAALGIVLIMTRRPTRLLFRLIIAAALIDVVVLAWLGERLIG